MKTNELNQQEMKSTNGGQMMPPSAGSGDSMPWIWPEQAPGYVSSTDGQGTLTPDNGTVSSDAGSGDDNGGPYIR